MDRVSWSDELLIGNSHLDEQHKHLIKLLDQLILASENPSLTDVSSALLAELMDTARTHFQDEEDFMAEHDFSAISEHKALHIEFMDKADELIQSSNLAADSVPSSLITFLRKWLIEHILVEDRKYLLQ